MIQSGFWTIIYVIGCLGVFIGGIISHQFYPEAPKEVYAIGYVSGTLSLVLTGLSFRFRGW